MTPATIPQVRKGPKQTPHQNNEITIKKAKEGKLPHVKKGK